MSIDKLQIKTVAVIGAGISGVCTAAHLLKQGLDVTLFERSSHAGGVWRLDERKASDPPYPNLKPSLGDYGRVLTDHIPYQTPPRTPDPDGKDDSIEEVQAANLGSSLELKDLEIIHAPPGPCYSGLRNNVSLRQMKTTLGDWPKELDEYVNQRHLEDYIQNIARTSGVNKIAEYNTRVESVTKAPAETKWNIWNICTTTLTKNGSDEGATLRLVERHWVFDAVVVASGHYNMPKIPDIPGLREWKARFPACIWHSKRYRNPSALRNHRVLVIGAGVSSNDIAKEAEGIADRVYQSSRGGDLDLPLSMLPPSTIRIGGIKAFVLDEPQDPSPPRHGHLPGYVEMTNGSKLCDIDQVILATGYLTSYPFLPQFHGDDKKADEAGAELLVTGDGSMIHNLHKDIFFISDPTLAFVGAPYHISTFSLFEFQAQVVARVFAGRAQLPDLQSMKVEYSGRVAKYGLGRDFHSLRGEGEELAYVRDLVEWMNTDTHLGLGAMVGHTNPFLIAYKEQRERLAALGRRREKGGGESFEHVVVSC